MRYYIVDDDINVVKILENIIIQRGLGKVIGYSYDGETALKDILEIKPDIVLIDYLMPKIDGASVAKRIKEQNKDIYFVAISQISDKEMIAEAYLSGVEFFISKPINVIEVEKVLNSIIDKINMFRTLSDLRKTLNRGFDQKIQENDMKNNKDNQINKIKEILCDIGIFGEKGAYDLINVCSILLDSGYSGDEVIDINSICSKLGEKPKIIKQRMRRAIAKGMRNIAYTGVEDNLNDIFIKYSNSLFDFEHIKAEMDYIRGKRISGGKVNLHKFIENLIIQSDMLI